MKRAVLRTTALILPLLAGIATAQPAAVNYQGYLEENGLPSEGIFDLEFRLFDATDGGIQIGNTINIDDIPVADGLFSTPLDFGDGAFDASPRYLQIAVRPGDSTGAFSILEGRVSFQSVPYSHNAVTATNAKTLGGFGPDNFAAADHMHSQLSTPDGANPDILRATNANEIEIEREVLLQDGVTLPNNMRISSSESGEFDFRDTQGSSRIRFEIDDQVNLIGDPTPPGFFEIRVEPEADSIQGTPLRLKGGDGGVGAAGGGIILRGGDAKDPGNHDGGDILFQSSTPAGAGNSGNVISFARIGIFRFDPEHPIHVGTNPATGNGAHVTLGGMWMNGSDRDSKTDFEELDTADVLRKVAELPVTTWRYKSENEDVRHIGPTAQDFMAAFELGESEKHIGTVDAVGVALAAIQELHAETQSLRKENDELRARLAALEAKK